MLRKHNYNGRECEASDTLNGYFNGVACQRVDMRGDVEPFFGSAYTIINTLDLGSGVVRYWVVPTDSDLRESIEELTRIESDFNERG